MKVKEILKNCAILLDDLALAKSMETGEYTAQEGEVRDLLLECCHFANTRIASEYIFLKDEVEIFSSNGVVSLDKITSKNLLDIISVKKDGYPITFTVRSGALYAQSGNLLIQFAYLPEKPNLNGEIGYYPGRINERVFAYAIVSEYLAIKGNIDDSNMWNEKFESCISKIYVKHREIVMPKRSWR